MHAGTIAAHVAYSAWLLAFSVFFFLSLALVKRYAEIHALTLSGSSTIPGRGYRSGDDRMLLQWGIASASVSVLVLAFYINSVAVVSLYAHPFILWGICPLILFWISRIWLIAYRNQLHDDPIFFAIPRLPLKCTTEVR